MIEARKSRVAWLLVAVALIGLLRDAVAFRMVRTATAASELAFANSLLQQMPYREFVALSGSVQFLGFVLGAICINRDLGRRTISLYLARNVAMWEYVAGKLFGVLAWLGFCFVLATLFTGTLGLVLKVRVGGVFFLAFVDGLVRLALGTAVALALRLWAGSAFAAIGGALALLAPPWMAALVGPDEIYPLRVLGYVGALLLPSSLPISIVREAFTAQTVDLPWGLVAASWAENLAYGVLLLGFSVVLGRRLTFEIETTGD